MAAKLTPMQLRAMKQRRNSFLTAGAAIAMCGGVYLYTMRAMSGARLRSALSPQRAAPCGCCCSQRADSMLHSERRYVL